MSFRFVLTVITVHSLNNYSCHIFKDNFASIHWTRLIMAQCWCLSNLIILWILLGFNLTRIIHPCADVCRPHTHYKAMFCQTITYAFVFIYLQQCALVIWHLTLFIATTIFCYDVIVTDISPDVFTLSLGRPGQSLQWTLAMFILTDPADYMTRRHAWRRLMLSHCSAGPRLLVFIICEVTVAIRKREPWLPQAL